MTLGTKICHPSVGDSVQGQTEEFYSYRLLLIIDSWDTDIPICTLYLCFNQLGTAFRTEIFLSFAIYYKQLGYWQPLSELSIMLF